MDGESCRNLRKEIFKMSFLLDAEASQGGIPPYVWVIVGIIAAIIGLVLAIKSFWVSKGVSVLLSLAGIVVSIIGLYNISDLIIFALIGGAMFAVSYIFLMGNAMFDSETEGDYLIMGSLVHDTNHPFKAFCGYIGGIVALTFFIFWAAYAWTFVIALVAFVLTLILNIAMIVERVRG